MIGLILASSPPPPDYPRDGQPACLYHARFRVQLDQQIAALRQQQAASIRIITGYRADLVRAHCVDQDVVLVANPFWDTDAALGLEIAACGGAEDLCIVSSAGEAHLRAGDLAGLPGARARALSRLAGQAQRTWVPPYSDAFALAGLPEGATIAPYVPLPYAQTDEARLARVLPAQDAAVNTHQPCTAHTARCQFWTWSADAVRPACCTRHLRELLIYTDRLLTRHGIVHWLDWGPLLGAVREGGLIPWDYDVDFGVMLTDRDRIADLNGEVRSDGHVLNMLEDYIWRIHLSTENQLHADMFPWHLEGEQLEMDGPWADEGAFPPHWLEQLEPIRLFGHEFLAPAPHVEFVRRYRYGDDYRTPQRYGDKPIGAAGVAARFVEQQQTRMRFRSDLQTLYDSLAHTEFAARYWLTGGQLLAAVRDGSLLMQTKPDADFLFLREDEAAFLDAARALAAAGFVPRTCYGDEGGKIWRYRLGKGYGKFDFCVAEASGGSYTTRSFGRARELESRLPAAGLERRRWLDRDWLMPDNAEAVLTAVYGDWRRVRGDWDALRENQSVVAERRWTTLRPERWRLDGAHGAAVVA